MKNSKSGIFFIVLLVSILLTVILVAVFAKRDVDEYQQMQESIENTQQEVDHLNDAMQDIRNQTEEGYDQLDQQIGDY